MIVLSFDGMGLTCVSEFWATILTGLGACVGQICYFWGIMGHYWDVITHMNFTDFHMAHAYNVMNKLKKTHALGRSLVIPENRATFFI